MISQILDVDSMLEVFSYLDVEDLLNCSQVSGTWRAILDNSNIWKRRLQEKTKSSRLWRSFALRLQKKSDKMLPADYKQSCQTIQGNCEQVDKTWREIDFRYLIRRLYLDPPSQADVHLGDEFTLFNLTKYSRNFMLVVDRNMELKTMFAALNYKRKKMERGCCVHVESNLIIFGCQGVVRIFDGVPMQQVNQIPEPRELAYYDVHLANGYLGGIAFDCVSRRHVVALWRMNSPTNIQLINRWTSESITFFEYLDEHSIVMSIVHKDPINEENRYNQIEVLSTKTLECQRSLSLSKSTQKATFASGFMLMALPTSCLRIMDVRSGTYVTVKCQSWNRSSKFACNSKFLAIAIQEADSLRISFYDWEACRNPASGPFAFPMTTGIVKNFHLTSMTIDETQLGLWGLTREFLDEGQADSSNIPFGRRTFMHVDFANDLFQDRNL